MAHPSLSGRAVESLRLGGMLGLAAVLLVAGGAQAQAPPPDSRARLQGVVVDQSTGQPVESATVSVEGTALSVVTGRWGSFEFGEAPLGSVTVQVRAPGHPSVVQEVQVRAGRVMFMRIELPSVAAFLDEILVRTHPEHGPGQAARSAADLLALEVPRTSMASGVVGENNLHIQLRQAMSFQGNTAPAILIDGIVVSGVSAFDALERIPAADVEDIQVLSGPAAAFLYPFAANGVINVVTKRGARGR